MVKIKLRTREFAKLIKSKKEQRLKRAAIHLTNQTKRNTSKRVRKRKGRVVERSSPSEFSRIDNGEMRASYTWEADHKSAKVGTNLKHGKFQELGTKTMAARENLQRTLKAERSNIKRILIGKKMV